MVDFLRNHQLNIMLGLGSICLIIALFVFITRTLAKKRKKILLLMEISAAVLLFSDRFAYIYRGDASTLGFYMVRICNYLVFSMTLFIIHAVNLYLTELLLHEAGLAAVPRRLKAGSVSAVIGQILLIISQFNGMYYTFDETNHYQRASLFFVCYIIPLLVLFLQLSVVINYYKSLNKGVRISLVLFTITPGVASIIQIFLYGLSLTNISMVGMVVVLYIFVLIDANEMVERAHRIEIENMQGEKVKMQRLFDQTARAFVTAVEKRDDYSVGHSARVADYAKRIADMSGKSEEECNEAYYAGLLHDVGMIGIPDSIIEKAEDLNDAEYDQIKQKPVLSAEILSSITEYPYLSTGARFACERFDGSGYPEGRKGGDIPEISRIIAVADAFDTMSSPKRFREPLSYPVVREEFIKQSGVQFDPVYSEIMVRIMDEERAEDENKDSMQVETKILCGKYRENISAGIPVESDIIRVAFEYSPAPHSEDGFSAPAIILFDSYDRRVHDNERAIEAYQYMEYGEFWFDDHSISTAIRKMEEKTTKKEIRSATEEGSLKYEIIMGRYEDHLKLKMSSPAFEKEVTVALPSGSKAAYIALTGENCEIRNVSAEKTGKTAGPGDIPRIAAETSYIDRMESDIKNVQVDRPRSASTEGIELPDRLEILFHTMSLPGASLVWHCPYIVLFYSEDGKVGGRNYREYGLIKLYGENEGDTEFAYNSITMKRTDEFPGWDAWKTAGKQGMDCKVALRRKNDRIVLKTKNLGIEIENITDVTDDLDKVFVALTGNQVAITDIRVK